MTEMGTSRSTLEKDSTNNCVCVPAGSSALPCNEYALLAQQNPKGDALPVAASILRCVLTVLCLAALFLIEHVSYDFRVLADLWPVMLERSNSC